MYIGKTWKLSLNHTITYNQERNNRYDRFVTTEMTKLFGTSAPAIVGHIPQELSCFIWYAIKNWSRVTAMILSTKVKKPPLVQGDLEIPVSIK